MQTDLQSMSFLQKSFNKSTEALVINMQNDDLDNDNHNQNKSFSPEDSFTTSSYMIRGTQNGNNDQWDRFVKLYYPLIFYWCRKRLGNHTRCSILDIIQNIFLKLSGSIKNYDLDREGRSFRGWLRAITNNAINDYFRENGKIEKYFRLLENPGDIKNFAQQELTEEDLSDSPEDPNEKIILMTRVLDMLHSKYSEESWEIFYLFIRDEKTSREVAEIKLIKPDTARRIKNRMLKRIRKECQDLNLGNDFFIPPKITINQ